ncbi:hypothetical protein J7E26_14815 [Bacillus sp. ISL-51]|uniref:hypothetical protein n=1 Tax=Bacteria TaxID=2 RepID=UPI001BECEA81|nr:MULTISPECIES: hypothetical protein [Bacteria]MBT2575199.1 hypothetical protein [Bacillus sp. ISL-51]MBT2633493.1 hypothetical protein [Bacillus sp. ISL-26]MBT2714073.1 hypothetical protein [Pseudomonas sp. ISL-88]
MFQPISSEDANQFETIKSLYKKLTSFSNVSLINREALGELVISKAFKTIKNQQIVSVRRQADLADF